MEENLRRESDILEMWRRLWVGGWLVGWDWSQADSEHVQRVHDYFNGGRWSKDETNLRHRQPPALCSRQLGCPSMSHFDNFLILGLGVCHEDAIRRGCCVGIFRIWDYGFDLKKKFPWSKLYCLGEESEVMSGFELAPAGAHFPTSRLRHQFYILNVFESLKLIILILIGLNSQRRADDGVTCWAPENLQGEDVKME